MPVSGCACAATSAAGVAGGAILSSIRKNTPLSPDISMVEMKRAVDEIRTRCQKLQVSKFPGM
jgi:hypothetical protein